MRTLRSSDLRRGAALSAALLLAACASTGGLAPRSRPDEASSLEAARSLEGAQVSPGAWPAADWWKQFGDPQLDGLVEEALSANPSLDVVRARLDRAVSLAVAAGAPLAPQVNGAFDVNRQRFSGTGIFPPPIGGEWFTQSQLALEFGYEFDLWGKNRAAYDAALGRARAAEVDAFAARLLLSAAVAHAYVLLARDFDLLDVAQAALEQRSTVYDLTRQRFAVGIDTKVEVKQAEASVSAQRQRIAQLQEDISLARDELAAFAGKGPDRGLSIARPRLRSAAVSLPATLPADLLGRRPDVLAQRWRVEAARRDIDSAKAEFYPNINLAALAGVQTVTFSKLFDQGSEIPSIGAAIRLPLFDGGRLRGNLGVKDADYDLAVGQYNQTLLDAVREVVDRIVSLRSVDAQTSEARVGLGAAEEAYDVAVARYRAGLGNYLQVLVSQTQVLEQRNLQADLRYREIDLSIDLIRALGGGFEASPGTRRPS